MARNCIIISRTDAIGDVVLTLPVAAVLRSLYPAARLLFLGRSYTKDIISACGNIDGFLNWDDLRDLPVREGARQLAAAGADTIIHVFPDPRIARMARLARIRERIGTANRLYHWRDCNVRVALSRKNSPYHEAQLNLKLLKPVGGRELYSLPEIEGMFGFDRAEPGDGRDRFAAVPDVYAAMLDPGRFNLILHPKSRGSAREWGLDNFGRLIELLPKDRYKIFLTGTAAEGYQLRPLLEKYAGLADLTGRLTLGELLSFIAKADGLVAASTGPLHLAAASGIHALGIYPPIRPMHPGRWAPVGPRAKVFVLDKECEDCRRSGDCACMRAITAAEVAAYLKEVE